MVTVEREVRHKSVAGSVCSVPYFVVVNTILADAGALEHASVLVCRAYTGTMSTAPGNGVSFSLEAETPGADFV